MIDYRALSQVVALAEHRSYARAARAIGISQPALTRTVQRLEAAYGIRLFDRGRRGVQPTPQGRQMLAAAAALIASGDDLDRQWRLIADGKAGVIRFGMAPMPARALLAPVLAARLAAAPLLRNEVVVRNVEALWPLLMAGDIEFFVAAEGQVPDHPPVRCEILGMFANSLLVRRGHPLLTARDTGFTYPLVMASRTGARLAREWLGAASAAVHVIEDYGALVELTATSDAVWLSSAHTVADQIALGRLVELPVAPPGDVPGATIIVYSLEGRMRSAAAIALRDALRTEARRLGDRSGSGDRSPTPPALPATPPAI